MMMKLRMATSSFTVMNKAINAVLANSHLIPLGRQAEQVTRLLISCQAVMNICVKSGESLSPFLIQITKFGGYKSCTCESIPLFIQLTS